MCGQHASKTRPSLSGGLYMARSSRLSMKKAWPTPFRACGLRWTIARNPGLRRDVRVSLMALIDLPAEAERKPRMRKYVRRALEVISQDGLPTPLYPDISKGELATLD